MASDVIQPPHRINWLCRRKEASGESDWIKSEVELAKEGMPRSLSHFWISTATMADLRRGQQDSTCPVSYSVYHFQTGSVHSYPTGPSFSTIHSSSLSGRGRIKTGDSQEPLYLASGSSLSPRPRGSSAFLRGQSSTRKEAGHFCDQTSR